MITQVFMKVKYDEVLKKILKSAQEIAAKANCGSKIMSTPKPSSDQVAINTGSGSIPATNTKQTHNLVPIISGNYEYELARIYLCPSSREYLCTPGKIIISQTGPGLADIGNRERSYHGSYGKKPNVDD